MLHRSLCNALSMRCTSTSTELIGREIYGGNTIVRLILKDTRRRNALSLTMIEQLHRELVEIDRIKKVRSVIIAAEGAAFSSGHDLKELRYSPADQLADEKRHHEIFDKCAALMQHVQSMHLPVIAEVSGVAAAAGCQLVASADIVVASERATFMVPGQKVGLFCSTPSIPLSRSVPSKVALDMLFTAEPITAEQALRAGLVSRVVPAGDERGEAIKVAEAIGKHSREVTALGKSFFYAQRDLPISHAYRLGSRVMTENLKLADAQEGIAAFVGKRQPEFSHGPEKAIDEQTLLKQKEKLQRREEEAKA